MPPARPADCYDLVADIGGTNTRVALAQGTALLPQTVRRYRNADYPGLEAVLRQFLADEDSVYCRAACVAVAGPVSDGVGSLTNLDWTIDLDTLARATQAETVSILNDLQAQGHGLAQLPEADLRRIMPMSDHAPDAVRLVIGVGTGFNVAPVFSGPDGVSVTAAEAGHASMPVRTEADLRLAQYVEAAHGFASVEDVLSGRGFERIHAWLGQESGDATTASAADIMAGFTDTADPRSTQAVAAFVRLLGAVSGDLALVHLPFGGIYLAGGVARAFAPHLQSLGFAQAFRDKGRFSDFMDGFGVSVIENDYAALTGCAGYLAANQTQAT